jgi:hypothetical protein
VIVKGGKEDMSLDTIFRLCMMRLIVFLITIILAVPNLNKTTTTITMMRIRRTPPTPAPMAATGTSGDSKLLPKCASVLNISFEKVVLLWIWDIEYFMRKSTY